MLARAVVAGRRALSALTCVALVAWPLLAAAESPEAGPAASDDLARRHFDSGVAYLEESDLENALKAFEKAYELSKRPAIQLNIATVQERRGDLNAAIKALESYLLAEPSGEHADTTRLRIQNLQKRLGEAAPEPAVVPPPAAAPVAPAPVPPPAPPPAPHAAEGNRTPAYIVLGIGGVSAVTAVVTGVMANSEYQSKKSECSPNCTESEVATGKTLALVSTIATGAAIVGGGIGLALFFTSSSGEARAAELQVGALPGGARAAARFRF